MDIYNIEMKDDKAADILLDFLSSDVVDPRVLFHVVHTRPHPSVVIKVESVNNADA